MGSSGGSGRSSEDSEGSGSRGCSREVSTRGARGLGEGREGAETRLSLE